MTYSPLPVHRSTVESLPRPCASCRVPSCHACIRNEAASGDRLPPSHPLPCSSSLTCTTHWRLFHCMCSAAPAHVPNSAAAAAPSSPDASTVLPPTPMPTLGATPEPDQDPVRECVEEAGWERGAGGEAPRFGCGGGKELCSDRRGVNGAPAPRPAAPVPAPDSDPRPSPGVRLDCS